MDSFINSLMQPVFRQNTAFNVVDYLKTRESGFRDSRIFNPDYGLNHLITNEQLAEHNINLNTDKVFCSEWLSGETIAMGTKCSKIVVYNVNTRKLDQLPCLYGDVDRSSDEARQENALQGVYSLNVNQSRTMLAAGFKNKVAIYSLPNLDPVYVGQGAHRREIRAVCWVNDEFLVSGSIDSKLALWNFQNPKPTEPGTISYVIKSPIQVCKYPYTLYDFAFNRFRRELAVLSNDNYVNTWDIETFQEISRVYLPSYHSVCLTQTGDGSMYIVGSGAYTFFLDSRTLQTIEKIETHYGSNTKSVNVRGNILTYGSQDSFIKFYDIRNMKHFTSSRDVNKFVMYHPSKFYIYPVPPCYMFHPTIYTISYDYSGTRLFTAGGPLENIYGSYAGLWQ